MNLPVVTDYIQSYPHIYQRYRSGRNKILVGTVVKSKVGELESDLREGFSIWLRKELTGVV